MSRTLFGGQLLNYDTKHKLLSFIPTFIVQKNIVNFHTLNSLRFTFFNSSNRSLTIFDVALIFDLFLKSNYLMNNSYITVILKNAFIFFYLAENKRLFNKQRPSNLEQLQ